MPALALASEFPPATREAWEAAVARVLKGADPEKVLAGRTIEGLRLAPLYPRAEGAVVAGRGATPWRIAARVDHPEPAAANALVLQELAGGADALVLSFAGAPSARGFGIAAESGALDRTLAGVMPDLVTIALETAPFDGRPVADLFAAWAERGGHAPADLSVDFGLDPLGDMARTGRLPLPWPDLSARFAETAATIAGRGFGGTIARVDTRAYHEAGAGEALELATALATGVAYLRALEAGGFDLAAARDALSFWLVADADEFLTVAKFRAFRRLWAAVEASCGLEPKPARLAAETAWRMTTRRDPWVNLLRNTVAAFSAGIGGADAISALPFTAALGLPDAFARRLARNGQLILLEEANVFRVADPVAGAGAFEALTDELAEAAWSLFGEIEREGGMARSLATGAIGRRLAETRAERAGQVATRRLPITGTSEFPDLREMPVAVLRPAPAAADPGSDAGPDGFEPLPSVRSAEPYEALRDRSDLLAASGAEARPRVFLAHLGPPSAFSARSTFARNAFEAVGIEALGNDGFPSLDALLAAFAAAGTGIACLCSSDAVYAEEAEPAARALRDRGARHVFLAGRPGEKAAAYEEAGITGFVSVGSDLPALLGPLVA